MKRVITVEMDKIDIDRLLELNVLGHYKVEDLLDTRHTSNPRVNPRDVVRAIASAVMERCKVTVEDAK